MTPPLPAVADTPVTAVMQAAVFHGVHDVRIEDVPVPQAIRTGEVLLEVGTVGVCGTDAAEWSKGAALFPIDAPHGVTGHVGPMVMGHEFSGTVVEVGAGVDPDWIGALVACCGAAPCGNCRQCKAGLTNRCERYSAVGLHRHGALARYVLAPAASCVRVDDLGLSADEAALCQPMSIAVHAARAATIGAGDRIVVLGVGGVGAFLVHVLAQWGHDHTAVDIDPDRLDVARELGADRVVLGGTADDADVIRQVAGGAVDVVFEVTGTAAGLRTALDLLPVGGRVVVVGIQKAPVELTLNTLTLREQRLIGVNAMVRETDFPEAVELVAVRRGRWDVVAPTVLGLADLVSGALEPIAAGRSPAIKVLIDPRADSSRPISGGA